jgi:hypothetical protein
MTGAYRFNGHRGDIFTPGYISILQNNPCYIACNNGERKAGVQSVPDINNGNAKDLWATVIWQRYNSYKNNVLSAPLLYKNFYRNFNYDNEYIGIEVPDGSAFGNSTDNSGCTTGNFNGDPYPRISDQQFILANHTATKINSLLPGKQFQCYAYSNHADIPSSNILINKNIDVQVVAAAFQSESSAAGLLGRWYKKHPNVSEYDYMNIPQWSGETPAFSFDNYKNTLSRLKLLNSQGIVMEASPAKFASLPFLFAGNRYLQNDINTDSSLQEFVNTMFTPAVAQSVLKLLHYWGDNNIMYGGDFFVDNKFKMPLFLQELNKAVSAAKNAGRDVSARLQELKAYLHYMVLYYDLVSDNRPFTQKSNKAAAICLYLASVNKLKLVNSYFLILDLVNKFPSNGEFYKKYNVTNGTAYLDGMLPMITEDEINSNFTSDLLQYGNIVPEYKFENVVDIISKMSSAGLKPVDKIKVAVGYTAGYENPGRCEFYFYATGPGSVKINCTSSFDIPSKGLINFTAEAVNSPLKVISDETITHANNTGIINITVPEKGLYRLSVVSKYRSYADLIITTNGNTFFKSGPFIGKHAENYFTDTLKSFPKYFYVPGISKVYFSLNNGCYTGNCLQASLATQVAGLKDNLGRTPVVERSQDDSTLYSMQVPAANSNSFWQVTRMREYNFCFANITNIQIFAEAKPEAGLPVINNEAFTVYPNPSNGNFYFRKNNAAMKFSSINIYDPLGNRVIGTYNAGSIDLSRFPAGVYIFSVQDQNKTIKGKLIKN